MTKTVLIVQGLTVTGTLADASADLAKEALGTSGLAKEDTIVLTDAMIHYASGARVYAGVMVIRKSDVAAAGVEGLSQGLTGYDVFGAIPGMAAGSL